MAPPQKRIHGKPEKPQKNSKVAIVDVVKTKTRHSKNPHFNKLMQQQREHEQAKKEKREMIEGKRVAREKNRSERNKAWRKLTKKGQPIMKERIKYMLNQLESMRKA